MICKSLKHISYVDGNLARIGGELHPCATLMFDLKARTGGTYEKRDEIYIFVLSR